MPIAINPPTDKTIDLAESKDKMRNFGNFSKPRKIT